MKMNFNFNDGPLPPRNVCEPHMPVVILIDNSGSMCGQAISNVEKSVNRFAADICKDPKAADRVDICVMSCNSFTGLVSYHRNEESRTFSRRWNEYVCGS